MTIACLAWGSLVYDPGTLPIRGDWHSDGPELPLEFARVSSGERITLVITQGDERCAVLWVTLDVPDLAAAVAALAEREKVTIPRIIETGIGRSPPSGGNAFACADVIAEWATAKGIAGVVWTSLPPGPRNDRGRMMSLSDVLGHLRSLNGKTWDCAADYILAAPKQITTPYRAALEAEIAARRANT